MASRTYIQHYADGTCKKFLRKKQGRPPSGLAKPINIRLFQSDAKIIALLESRLGVYWNTNQFVRDAIHEKLLDSMYTEFIKQ